ncbi:MAG: fumarylacetoacetate hydrolase family protein [Hyphomicrobiaceae bacterium]|nr:fumarylacetoacetate hydrolase family protein [Hyphomicrobiaceae bacterium]
MSAPSLAARLAEARARAGALDPAPWRGAVADVADAYLVQSELAKLAGGQVRAWKVTALTAAQQQRYGTNKPVAGALLAPFFHTSPAVVPLAQFVAPLIECEVAFLLGRDLPRRAAPYAREEIEASVEAIVPAMEIADCRWPADAPDLLKLADDMGNGAFIAGAGVLNWRGIDLAGIEIVLALEGTLIQSGNAAKVLGDPLRALEELANAQPLPAGGLRRGQIVTTGTCTTPVPLRPGRHKCRFRTARRDHLDGRIDWLRPRLPMAARRRVSRSGISFLPLRPYDRQSPTAGRASPPDLKTEP